MSWLLTFWRGKKVESNPQNDTKETANALVTDKQKTLKYDFHSADLERAASAAKFLEKSKYAKQLYELENEQNQTQQLHGTVRQKKVELFAENEGIRLITAHVQQERKALENDSNASKGRMNYQDNLTRKRLRDQLSQETRLLEQRLGKEEERIKAQETGRIKSVEYEAELRYQNDLKILNARLKGEAQVERDNRDIQLERSRIEASEWRETVLQSISTAGSMFGSGISALLADHEKVTMAVLSGSALAAGIYASRYGISSTVKFVESRIGKPSLVRETSRINAIDVIHHPIKTFISLTRRPVDPLKGIILRPELEESLRKIALSTRHTKTNKGFYRNVLMAGPPGTGKTMFAKGLAKHSGMDFAILTGGDIAPLGKSGVTNIHKVFDWASTSRKGVVLFIDEADAFLRKRGQEQISEDLRASLNAFLYRTGEQSNRFMLLLGSNQPEQFDWAINDRMDEIVHFDLPTLPQRIRLIRQYFDLYLLQPSLDKRQRIRLDKEVDYTAICNRVAEHTEGLSGRELSKLAIAWQTAAFSSEDGTLTTAMMDSIADTSILANKKKQIWRKHRLPSSLPVNEPPPTPTISLATL